MTLTEALAYDAAALCCEQWCSSGDDCCQGECDCGMARARAVIAILQAAARKEPPVT